MTHASSAVDGRVERQARLASPVWDVPVVGLMMHRAWTDELLSRASEVELDFLEVFPENYMRRGARALREISSLAECWPVVCHGVHMSLGSLEALDSSYLEVLSGLVTEIDSPWCSEHVGVSVSGGEVLHDILPVPLNAGSQRRIVERVRGAQDRLGRPLALENTACYFEPPGSCMSEAEFYAGLFEEADTSWLLDVNNLWVNASNSGFDVAAYLDALPMDRVIEIHIGGFTVEPGSGLLIDSHGAAPAAPVWRLLEEVLVRAGPTPVLLEWERHCPGLDAALGQIERIREVWRRAEKRARVAPHDVHEGMQQELGA